MQPERCPMCGDRHKARFEIPQAACLTIPPPKYADEFECGSLDYDGSFRQSNWCKREAGEILWRLRLTLTEIAWAARCEYERTKKFNEGYDAAVKGDG